jgi:hypothetical protein
MARHIKKSPNEAFDGLRKAEKAQKFVTLT